MDETTTVRSKRGFAGMDQARQREIASKGGTAAHAHGHAHEFTSEEARAAGKRGGEAVSQDRQHMAAIGRKGGVSKGTAYRAQRTADKQVVEHALPEGDRVLGRR